MLGDLYAGENLMDLAESAYERAIDLDPRPAVRASVPRGRGPVPARRDRRRRRKLLAHLKAVRGGSLERADARKLLKLEARLKMAEGEGSEETVKILEEILRLDPLDGDALMLLGQHYAKQNQPDKAILYLERAAGIEAFEVEAKIRWAQILVSLGRYADAVPLLRRAQEIKPRESRRALPRAGRAAGAFEGEIREPVGRGFESRLRHVGKRGRQNKMGPTPTAGTCPAPSASPEGRRPSRS